MLKILQARLQQYINRELPDVQAGFRRGRETRDQTANFHCSIIQLCLTFCDPRDYSPSGSSLHRIFQEESWSGLPFPTPTSIGIIEKTREYQKTIYFWFIDYTKAFDCVNHSKLWKILKVIGIPDHLMCLLRSLYAGQEATVRTRHGTTDWFKIRKGVCQGCILSPHLFNFYAEYITRNAGLEETQAGIKIAGRKSMTSDMQMTPPSWQK